PPGSTSSDTPPWSRTGSLLKSPDQQQKRYENPELQQCVAAQFTVGIDALKFGLEPARRGQFGGMPRQGNVVRRHPADYYRQDDRGRAGRTGEHPRDDRGTERDATDELDQNDAAPPDCAPGAPHVDRGQTSDVHPAIVDWARADDAPRHFTNPRI